MAECPIHFGDFLGDFFFFKLLKTRKDVYLPDNVNAKKDLIKQRGRERKMDQTATFLLPCPQRGSGFFSCSDQCRAPCPSLQHRQGDFSPMVEGGCRTENWLCCLRMGIPEMKDICAFLDIYIPSVGYYNCASMQNIVKYYLFHICNSPVLKILLVSIKMKTPVRSLNETHGCFSLKGYLSSA